MYKKNRGQVWIETVLYTVIGLAIIALVLSFAYPKLRAAQENLLIEQSIATLNNLDKVINIVNERGPGNIKTYTLSIKRGRLIFDEKNEKISLEIKGIKTEYSEPGAPFSDGRVSVTTNEASKGYTVTLSLSYLYPDNPTKKLIDIEVGDSALPDEIKEFVQAANPYIISIAYGESSNTILIEEWISSS